jgi:hypothetical protein
MSTKFEQLLDLLVNEEMDKANELFHAIVVEKSREIYENLIAEEEQKDVEEGMADEDVEEGMADEDVEEGMDSDEMGMDDDMELEDSYMADGEEGGEVGGDATDDFMGDIEAGDDEGDMDSEEDEDAAIMDIKNAIADLEAAFAELEAAQGGEEPHGEFGDEMDDEEGDVETDEMMGGMTSAFEGKRMTREYVEKVGNDWDKNSMKSQGQHVAAGTGDKESGPAEGKSPIASGANKPGPAGVNAKNLVQGASEQAPDGTSPKGKAGGLVKNAQTMNTGNQNVPGGKVSVKGLKKVGEKGTNPGPVGSGSGDKAGQTSIDPATKKQFLPQYGKK